MSTTQQTSTQAKQVNFTASFVCDTKFKAAMLRIIEIPTKFQTNKFLLSKLKDYEDSQYIYINHKKINGTTLQKDIKYKVYLLFEDFTSDEDKYILYIKQTLFKNKGKLDNRQFNSEIEINELSDSE